MIKFSNVTKKYGDKVAVDGLSFNVEEGEFFVLVGPSGCGKTTTLKMINRLIPLTSGYIYFKDKPLSDYNINKMRFDIGYVLQQIALFPHMTVRDNIAQVPMMLGWDKKRINDRVESLLEMVGLEGKQYMNRYPDELSGGQKQRIGVCRALAADPPVILMDEPFSALDPISRESLQQDLLDLQAKIKKTIIFVTHDMDEAMKLADRICILKNGAIEQIGTPDELVNQPASEFVKQFIGTKHSIHTAKDIMVPVELKEDINNYGSKSNEYMVVNINEPLDHLLKHLTNNEKIFVVNDEEQLVGYVTTSSMIEFLAQNGLNGGGKS